ncbi:PIR Superfamily Protein [Plasmodium ovale wallikeri]|uniref:PIR Superfamily Protein n=1 Tax=Plasmodium ovale wallikeri TaxID=864142 RepID=A0A1A9ARL1_PLAOA|nr:PIR Superfamily Protein [Plasmodium ovale wallikeri]
MVRNLKKLPKIKKCEGRKGRCFYLKHCACYKMRKSFSKYSNDINKERILSKFRGIMNSINYKELKDKHCGCPLYNDEKAWKEQKYLDYYLKKNSSISCNDYDINKCKMYHEFVTYISKLYQ